MDWNAINGITIERVLKLILIPGLDNISFTISVCLFLDAKINGVLWKINDMNSINSEFCKLNKNNECEISLYDVK